MNRSHIARSWWRYATIGAIFATIILTEAGQIRVIGMSSGAKLPFSMVLRIPVAYYGFWAVATPLIIWLTRKLPLTPNRWPASIAAHLVAWCVLGVVHACYRIPLHHFVYPWMPLPGGKAGLFWYYFAGNITSNLLIYSVVALVSYSVSYLHTSQERELRASQLEARLGEARLHALKMQIQPHFLFNTFNSISALMHKDIEAAENMITDLSDLLRLTLEASNVHEVTIRDELEILDPYLSIQRTRFQDRLSIQCDVQPETLSAMLPNLTLHTLVENALRHGVAQRSSDGQVWIQVCREADMLIIRVSDNGPGLDATIGDVFDRGIGLPNTRGRLDQLYGSNYRLELTNRDGGGLSAVVAIPFHDEPVNVSSNGAIKE